jgi:Protein of unknown function (DUF2924)
MMIKRRESRSDADTLPRPTPRSDSIPALGETISGFVDLDASGLCLQWRNHLGGNPPAHLPRWLLLRILAHRVQAAALGSLDKETLRVLRQPKGRRLEASDARPFETRTPITRDGADLRTGALLTREWNGKLERVMILDQGVAWNRETYGSLSQVAKAMTGTSWNGHRFFGLRATKSHRSAIPVSREGIATALRAISLQLKQAKRQSSSRRFPQRHRSTQAGRWRSFVRQGTGRAGR